MASGEIVTTAEAAQDAAAAGRTVILVRSETSPDDVHGMSVAAGILTARGGLASHAAVVARGWGIPAVVGAAGLDVRDGEIDAGGRTMRAGETVTIGGAARARSSGGSRGLTEPAPEAATLLAWASGLGVAIAAGDEPAPASAGVSTGTAQVTIDACVRRLGTKGFATAASLADALLASPRPSSRCSTYSSSTAWRRRSRAPTA